MNRAAGVAGLALTLLVHGALVAMLAFVKPPPPLPVRAGAGVARPKSVGVGLCGKRRCQQGEVKRRRRDPEPDPVEDLPVLEAALFPALGMREPDPSQLPKLETYEQPEIVEDTVNLDRETPPPEEKKKKEFDPKEAKRDPKHKDEKLEDILEDFEDDDPRKRATHLSKIIGHEGGVIGGTATEVKAGNLYAVQVGREIRKRFVAPSYIDVAALADLTVRVKVTKLSPEGEILEFEVVKKSGNSGYDDAALAAIQEFVPEEGGTKTLPPPDPDVLRYVNQKGMTVELSGKYLAR